MPSQWNRRRSGSPAFEDRPAPISRPIRPDVTDLISHDARSIGRREPCRERDNSERSVKGETHGVDGDRRGRLI